MQIPSSLRSNHPTTLQRHATMSASNRWCAAQFAVMQRRVTLTAQKKKKAAKVRAAEVVEEVDLGRGTPRTFWDRSSWTSLKRKSTATKLRVQRALRGHTPSEIKRTPGSWLLPLPSGPTTLQSAPCPSISPGLRGRRTRCHVHPGPYCRRLSRPSR